MANDFIFFWKMTSLWQLANQLASKATNSSLQSDSCYFLKQLNVDFILNVISKELMISSKHYNLWASITLRTVQWEVYTSSIKMIIKNDGSIKKHLTVEFLDKKQTYLGTLLIIHVEDSKHKTCLLWPSSNIKIIWENRYDTQFL
jgi:hypothetical protein